MTATDNQNPNARYRLPGQNLYAPILDQPEMSMDDSTGNMDQDDQPQVDALPSPPPIPAPENAGTTSPVSGGASMAPPPAPSPDPKAYDQLKNLPLDQSGSLNTLPAPPAPPSASDALRNLTPPPVPGQPKWYQRLAAAALGGAAGYANASGHGTIVPQATLQKAEGNILQPGYAKARADYETQRSDLENQADQDIREQQAQALEDQREAMAAQRTENTRLAQQAQDDRTQAVKDKATDSQRKGFDALTKGHAVVWQPPTAPVPPGFTTVTSPDAPGMVGLIPAGVRQAPKELVDGGYLPGYKAGAPVDSDTLSKALDAFYKEDRTPQAKNPTEVSLYQDANNPSSATHAQSAAALAAMQKDKLQLKPPPPPKVMTAAEQKLIDQRAVQKGANKVMQQTFSQGGQLEDAVTNAQKYFADDPDVADYRNEIVQELQKRVIQQKQGAPARPKGLAALNAMGAPAPSVPAAGPAGSNAGSNGAPPPPPAPRPAPPVPAAAPIAAPSPAQRPTPAPVRAPVPQGAAPVIGSVKYLKGQAVKITKVYADGSVDYQPVQQ